MFLLYQKKDKAYPERIKIGDDLYYINADFRNILRIFDMLNDGNIPEHKKIEKLKSWFFEYNLTENILNVSPEVIIDSFIGFLDTQTQTPVSDYAAATPFQKGALDDRDEETETENTRQFCYNFDAEEIYAGFIGEYGIDLIYTEFLHWYKFKILLNNLSPESAFKRKIELRFTDLSGVRDISLIKAKESVQLPDFDDKETEQELFELKEIKEFNEIWGKAGNN